MQLNEIYLSMDPCIIQHLLIEWNQVRSVMHICLTCRGLGICLTAISELFMGLTFTLCLLDVFPLKCTSPDVILYGGAEFNLSHQGTPNFLNVRGLSLGLPKTVQAKPGPHTELHNCPCCRTYCCMNKFISLCENDFDKLRSCLFTNSEQKINWQHFWWSINLLNQISCKNDQKPLVPGAQMWGCSFYLHFLYQC